MRICLLNLPFSTVRLPALGLAQLKGRVTTLFGSRVEVEVRYLNHDFSAFLGLDLYEKIANHEEINHQAGFGDWYFRQIAFPDAPDNSDAYLKKFFRTPTVERELVMRACEKRAELDAWFDQMVEQHALSQPEIVGFTAMFRQTAANIGMARKIKSVNPEALVVSGGACCEGPMGRELANRVGAFDYVFSGPALVSFPEFVGAALEQRLEGIRIRGVFSRPARGASRLSVVDEQSPEIGQDHDINDVISVDHGDYLRSFDALVAADARGKPQLLFETSRGCWWGEIQHCTFCGLNGESMEFREMTAENALRQFESIFEYYPRVSYFQCVDEILPHRYLKTVLPRLEPPAGATLFYEVKANLREEEVRLLADSHIRVIQPGIESLNSDVLKLMRKGTTAFQNIRLLMYCALYGVAPKWGILMGFPGEQEISYLKLLDDVPLLVHLPPPGGVNPVRFDRFSPYQKRPHEYGLELRPFDFYAFIFPYEDAALTNLAYHFAHRDPRFYVPFGRWRAKVQQSIDVWYERWSGKQGCVPAQLHFESADGPVVYDSRSGAVVKHRLSHAAHEVLTTLTAPKTMNQLADSKIAREPAVDVEREVAELRERGLLFEENACFLSLVLPRERAVMPWDEEDEWNFAPISYLATR